MIREERQSKINKREDPEKRIIPCRVNRVIVGLRINALMERIPPIIEERRPAPELVPKQTEADTISGPQGGERIMPFLDVEHILTRKEVTERSAMRQ